MNRVTLPRSIFNRLIQLAQNSPDEEICGLISRDHHGFKNCYPIVNIARDNKRFFMLDPQSQIAAIRLMRENGEELAAIYHTHPASPPLPSPADVEQHEYPDALYLIISLLTKSVPEMRGFYIRGSNIHEVSIELEGDSP